MNAKFFIGKVSTVSEATFTNLKSRGRLTYLNQGFFNLIFAIEQSFEKFCNNEYVFDSCVEDIMQNSSHHMYFPCSQHRNEILTCTIIYYLTTRMRRHSALQNRDQKYKSTKLKKQSK